MHAYMFVYINVCISNRENLILKMHFLVLFITESYIGGVSIVNYTLGVMQSFPLGGVARV